MWSSDKRAPVGSFLLWLFLLSAFSSAVSMLLEPCSVAFAGDGRVTVGYVIYALMGIFISTPSPMLACYIALRRRGEIRGPREFCGRVLRCARPLRAALTLAGFCLAALLAGIVCGAPTGAPWYLMPAALPLMILGGGVEEVGWRGFFQPALEERMPAAAATLVTAAVWYVWHLPLWLLPSSNHYGDSLAGFAITICVWAFAAAALYRFTGSVFACVLYHAFLNSMGAVWDWNALFDAMPKQPVMIAYYALLLFVALALFRAAERRDGAGRERLRGGAGG